MLQLLSRDFPSQFEKIMGADTVAVFSFWDQLHGSADGYEFWQEHGYLRGKTPRDLQHSLPFCVHEDAGPFTKNKSVQLIQYGSLLGIGSDMEVRYIAWAGEKLLMHDEGNDKGALAWETFFDDLLCLWKSESSDGRQILEDRDQNGIFR